MQKVFINKISYSIFLSILILLFNSHFAIPEDKIFETTVVVSSLDNLELGSTTLDDLLLTLKNKNKNFKLDNGNFNFKIMHKYNDYLDAPYTITLSFTDQLYDNSSEFKLFFTPKSKLLYRVEIKTDGNKDDLFKFLKRKYGPPVSYKNACYHWDSKPDGAGEVFYNILFCPTGAYSPKITLFWTDWDYLYTKAVLEGVEKR